uniref:G protein-coupled receptor n=1 Tax=Steinernema glaseri TaxID=37863 RepID=A0A1I8A9M7_9BILA
MGPLPLVLYINFSVQFLSSLFTVVFNTYTLRVQLKLEKANTELTMLLAHVLLHFLFACPTVVHSGYQLFAIGESWTLMFYKCSPQVIHLLPLDDNRNHDLIFWTGVFAYSAIVSTGLADLFLGMDRFSAITMPMAYRYRFKNKFAILAITLCVSITVSMSTVIAMQRIEAPPEAIMFGAHIDVFIVSIHVNMNNALSLLNVTITCIFMFKLRKFHGNRSTTTPVNTDLIKANITVVYQMLLALTFQITPTFTSSLVYFALGWNWGLVLGPYPLTLLTVYIFSCSILYRIKLGTRVQLIKVSSAEATAVHKTIGSTNTRQIPAHQ